MIDILDIIMRIRFEHPFYTLFVIPFLLFLAWSLKNKLKKRRLLLVFTRAVFLILLGLSMGYPVLLESRIEVGELAPMVILSDSSESMQIYNRTFIAPKILNGLKSGLNQMMLEGDVKIKEFSKGNSTALGDGLYAILSDFSGKPGTIILISDGNNNKGRNPIDVARAFRQTNFTLNVVAPDVIEYDWFIKDVKIDSKVSQDTEFTFTVDVGYTGSKIGKSSLIVYTDDVRKYGKTISQGDEVTRHEFRMKLSGIGVHEFRFELTPQEPDKLPFNNIYYKAVEVVEKPNLLLVTNHASSPMAKVLDDLYEVDVSSTIPSNLKKYAGVVLDDQYIDNIRHKTPNLRNYLLDGGGLLVVGGKNSYDFGNYSGTHFETLLPVTSSNEPKDKRKALEVMFVIDISKSTEYGKGESKIDVEKAIILRMIEDLDNNDSVGVIAFNNQPFLVSPLSPIGGKKLDLADKIRKLKFDGGTKIKPALESAANMLEYGSKQKVIILVSDGVTDVADKKYSLETIRFFEDKGITLYTVGVGFDTAEPFMKEAAFRSGGIYFRPHETERLKLEFNEEYKDEAGNKLRIRDESHYITYNIDLSKEEITGLDTTYRKGPARGLITTMGNSPVITVWRFGLGRVVSWTTDNGMEWSKELFKGDNRLLAKSTNWVLGGLEQNKKVMLDPFDAGLGEVASFYVSSPCRPDVSATYQGDNPFEVKISQISGITYLATFIAQENGIAYIGASCGEESDTGGLAINYPVEYSQLNNNEEILTQLTYQSRGGYYTSDEIDEIVKTVLEESIQTSTVTITEKRILWMFPLALAFFIYFMDSVIRRVLTILEMRKQKG